MAVPDSEIDATSPDLEPYLITGIRDGLGPAERVPLRREITEWAESTKDTDHFQVQLFLLALEVFHARKEHEKLSYFQIAGIHGFPNVRWNENTQPQAQDKDYCTHNSILFPFWHRPYVLLFEQVLYNIIVDEIIPTCLTKNPKNSNDTKFHDTLRNAIKTWRFPYWDWAATDDLPKLVKELTFPIDIKKVPSQTDVPSGHIVNPLNKFTMPSKDPMGKWGIKPIPEDAEKTKWRPYHKSKGISRCAKYDNSTPLTHEPPPHWVVGSIDNAKASEALKGGKWYDDKDPYTLKENVYRLYTSKDLKQFAAFSTTLYSEDEATDKKKGLDQHGNKDVSQSYSSLEFIHNNIHSWVGGPDNLTAGHMADVPVAGFDPVFWLHHCNIDRLAAIWQFINPNSWFDKQEEQLQDPGNWSIREGTWATPTTKLAPFHKKVQPSPEYFTSNDVRDWMKLGYTYPELQPWNFKSHDEYHKSVCSTLNHLYAATKKLVNSAPKLNLDPTALVAQFQELAGLDHDYVINAVYRKFALGGVPFTINFYLSHQDGSQTVRTRVGRIYNFSSAINLESEGNCLKCISQERAGVKASGSIPLTNIMIKKAQDPDCPLNSLLPDDSVNYLRDHLSWEVTDRSGTVIPLDPHDPFIEVHVAKGTPEHADPLHLLSSYHSYTLISRITDNKVGGAGYVPT